MQNEKLVKQALETLLQGKDFMLAQAPDILQQIIKVETVKAYIGFGISFSLAGFSAYLFHRYRKADSFSDSDWLGGCVIVGLLSLAPLIVNTYTLVMIHYAPKVFLINEFIK